MKTPVKIEKKTAPKKAATPRITPPPIENMPNLVPVANIRVWDLDEMMVEINRLRAEHQEFIETHSTRPSWRDDITRRKGIIQGLNMWDDFLRKG